MSLSANGAASRHPTVRDGAMRHRIMPVAAIAAIALLIALDCVCAGVKTHRPSHWPRHRVHLPPVYRIRCAALFESSPCGPDPAMLRLLQRPQWRPELAPEPLRAVPSR